jgi:nucleotidyltransferase/DNA polymerase involved in DNA repair
MMSSILYLLAPHLPVQVEQRQVGETAKGLIVGGRPWDDAVVLDCCPVAAAAGVTAGMSLMRAALRCPEARFRPADHAAYQAAHTAIQAALRQFSDRLETVGLGTFYLEIGHIRRRFPDSEALAHQIAAAAGEASGLMIRAGLAGQRFTAQQAARLADDNDNATLCIAAGAEKRFLAPLPLSSLPANDELIRRLNLLGITTLGGLARLSRNAVIRQFGAEAGFWHDLAAAADPRPLLPDAPPLELRHGRDFEPPVADRWALLNVARSLTEALAAKLGAHHHQAQGVRLELTMEDGAASAAAASVEPPSADAARLWRQIERLAERCSVQQAVARCAIVVYPLRPAHLGAVQTTLFSAVTDERARRLQEELRRLRSRFGNDCVQTAATLERPDAEQIDVVTDPRGVPVALQIARWVSAQSVGVAQIYEHWREQRNWWAQPLARDYYRLEDEAGRVRIVFWDQVADAWFQEARM